MCCIYSYASNESFFFADLRLEDNPADRFIGGLALAFGLVLILFQLRSLLFLVVPTSWYDQISVLQRFLVSGMARKEASTKKAARFKTGRLVENAISMHDASLSSKSPRSINGNTTAYGSALLAFEGTMDDRESVGGILWTYKSIFNGSLFDQEGVWFHARLLASNMSQYTVMLFYMIFFPLLMYYYIWYPVDDETAAPTASPAPTVDPIVARADGWQPHLEEFLDTFRSSTNEKVRELLWERLNANVTADFAGEILDAISNTSIRTTLNRIDRDTLSTIVRWGSEILERATGDVGNQRRRLEDDWLDDLIPERWM